MRAWSKRVRAAAAGLLFFLTGLLGGCAPSPAEPQQGILWSLSEVSCTVTMGETKLEGLCSHSLEGLSTFETRDPDTLSGLTVQYRQGEYTVQMAGLTQNRQGAVMDSSIFGRLFSALDNGAAAGMEWEGGQWSGTLPSGEVMTVETQQDGTLLALAVPAWQLTARFSSPEE